MHDDEDYEEESKIKRFLKRTYLIIIAFFLISLIIISIGPGYHILSYLSGRIVSSELQEDYTFGIKTNKVIFEETVWDILNKIYLENQKHEFKICLTGKKESNNYIITGLYVPKIYEQTPTSVLSQVCNNETIISLHSHPPLRCLFSDQDFKSYEQFKKINPDGIIGLMCDVETLTFYGYN